MKDWAEAIKDSCPTMRQMHEALVELSKAIRSK